MWFRFLVCRVLVNDMSISLMYQISLFVWCRMTDKKIPPIAPHSDRLLELLKIETHKELEIEKKERAVYQKVINHKMEMMSGIIQV